MSFLLFCNFRWNPYFYSVSCFALFWSKKILAKTDSVHENARFFSLPDTNSVRQFLLKIHFFDVSHFWMTTFKNPIFIGFFGLFHLFFFFFLFLFLQHKKEKHKKCNFLFENLIFDNPKFAKTLFWHTVTLFVLLKMPKNTIKLGKTAKKLGPVFNL